MPTENVVEIPEEVVEEKVDVVMDELSPEEVKMAGKHKIIPVVENKEVKKEEIKKEEVKAEVKEEDYDTFDKVHDLYDNNKDAFYALPRAIKNQYHNAKGLYKRVKEEEEKRKKYENDSDFNRLQEGVSKAKIDRLSRRIAEAKGDPDLKGLTVEEIEEIVGAIQNKEEDEDRPLTAKDLDNIEAKKLSENKRKEQEEQERRSVVAEKIKETEEYAKENISDLTGGKYENFDDVVTLAHEIAKAKPRFQKVIGEALNGDERIEDVVDTIIDIAKLNPKWGETVNKTDAERIEKNSQKQRTSASVTSGKGGRVVSHDDLTAEDASRLSKEQWEKLPKEVRRRLLSQV